MNRRGTIWSPSTRLRYMAQLDALRALAAAMVVVYHFWRPAREAVHFGGIGVRVFFVLSGFLITGILLHAREMVDQGEAARGGAVRRFYLRRFLRIFPLYYFALIVAWLGRVSGIRAELPWHAAYLSNVRFFLDNAAHPGVWGGHLSHLWSLAVEEQFYLLWPWIILCARRSWLPGIALGLVAVGPVFRGVVAQLTGNDVTPILPLGCIDSLALGAYLAMTVDSGFDAHPLVRPIGPAALWAGAILFAAHQAALGSSGLWLFRIVAFDLAIALMGAWLVARAAKGFTGPAGRLLELGPLRYLGTISYGIYVYHLMLPELLPRVARRLGHADLLAPLGDQTVPYLLFYSALTVGVAAVSWHAFESPVNRLKDRLDRRPVAPRARVPAPAAVPVGQYPSDPAGGPADASRPR